MRYGSICSGIEAASVAWHPLGWRASFFSEIEPFPRAVLAARWPDVPCHGDFTTIKADDYDAIDLLVGGTPCQSFSIAGLRGGLADERGNLSLEYCRLAQRLRPTWLVWENVPGVLSLDGGRAMASIVGALGQLGYGWTYRVLDAQYCGVPQQRRRVILVGYLGDWRSAAKVLFERESLRRDSPPGREAGATVAALTANGVGTCGADDNQGQAGHLIASTEAFVADIAATLPSGGNSTGGNRQPGMSAETAASMLVAYPLRAQAQMAHDPTLDTLITHSLRGEGFDASEDGTGRGIPLVPVAFDCKTSGHHGFSVGTVAPTLRAMGGRNRNANGGGQIAISVALRGREGGGTAELSGEVATALRASQGGGDKPHVLTNAVRRLTPRECERLQGFPDDYTLIPWRKRPAERCPDGPRYKALGNSMAIPVMRWVGERIQAFEEGRL